MEAVEAATSPNSRLVGLVVLVVNVYVLSNVIIFFWANERVLKFWGGADGGE